MSTKLNQWGALLLAYGIVALVLPSVTGMQLRVFNLFGQNSTKAAIGSVILGAVLWIIGRAGVAGSMPVEQASVGNPPPPPLPNFNASTAERTCPKCGAVASPGDNFCMQCGGSFTSVAPPPVSRTAAPGPSTSRQGGGCMKNGCLVMLLVIAGGVGWFFFAGGGGTYTPPARTEPGVPPRVAGTLTEFPVDPATTNRLEPTSVITQTFEPGKTGAATPSVATGPQTLPPGIPTSSIPQVATTMTSTTYRNGPDATPVNVHVLQTTNPGIAGQWAQGIAQSSGGQLQGTRVQSPLGQTYEGWSVRSPTILVFVLTNRSSGNIIILYTPQPAGFEATQRLAGSVGNGRGLRDYPGVVDTFGALPAAPPPGYSLSNMTNFSGNDLTSSLNQAQSGMDPKLVEALGQVLQVVRLLIPERGTMAQYRNTQGQEKGVLIGNYGSARKAAVAYRMLYWTFGLVMKSSKAAGFEGLTFSDPGGKAMIFQKGPYIGFTVVPGSAADSELAELARGVQF